MPKCEVCKKEVEALYPISWKRGYSGILEYSRDACMECALRMVYGLMPSLRLLITECSYAPEIEREAQRRGLDKMSQEQRDKYFFGSED